MHMAVYITIYLFCTFVAQSCGTRFGVIQSNWRNATIVLLKLWKMATIGIGSICTVALTPNPSSTVSGCLPVETCSIHCVQTGYSLLVTHANAWAPDKHGSSFSS